MKHKNDCLVCGEKLHYEKESFETVCFFCNKTYNSNVTCENGHYVCDGCHAADALDIVTNFCLNKPSLNPLKMAMQIMKHPSINMHGPEHHYLVPAVLLTSYYLALGDLGSLEQKLEEARKRSKNILGGFCGFYGACGAAIGTGIFVSIATGATPYAKQEWKHCNLITAQSLTSISKFGGPRCCKRDTYISLMEAVNFIEDTLGVQLERANEVSCTFFDENTECLHHECSFYPSQVKTA